MIRAWDRLGTQEREVFRATVAFLSERLSERETIEWALKLDRSQRVKRIAIEDLLNNPRRQGLQDPWMSAWRLIEESWNSEGFGEGDGTSIYTIQDRIRGGERSGALVKEISNLVYPYVKVERIDDWRWSYLKKPIVPKKVEHLLSARLTSGRLVDLDIIQLGIIFEIDFLLSLANSLEAAVNCGLDIARRLGGGEKRSFLILGMLYRVYYTQLSPREGGGEEPDAHHQGIAPAVKFLHAVVTRIADIDPSIARSILSRWKENTSVVYRRLWAAVARNKQLVSADAVVEFLNQTDERQFWNLHDFPEISELRATRFGEFSSLEQSEIARRLKKGPPRTLWPRNADKHKIDDARTYWAARELKRIEIGSRVLPASSKSWLESRIGRFSDLPDMSLDDGYLEGASAGFREAQADPLYDTLAGIERLKALESALGSARLSWDDDPADRANDWINLAGNARLLLADLENTGDGGNDYPKVWNRFGWAHRPAQEEPKHIETPELNIEAGRVLSLIDQLSDPTLGAAIEGVCAWLDAWARQVAKLPLIRSVWARLWPLAVEATNGSLDSEDDANLSTVAWHTDTEQEPMDLDTLNTPAGKLVGVFLSACPPLNEGGMPFKAGSPERFMRDTVISADGRSKLIAQHRMIETIGYFLRADRHWAETNLIEPLMRDDRAALALWRAIARRTHPASVLNIIGVAIAERATDLRLGRETRQRLVFSLVIETLHAFRKGQEPAVPHARVQQMLRTLDSEVRASAANAVQQFIREVAGERLKDGAGREARLATDELFRVAAIPFFRKVWPQERALSTPGVSGALADIPATSGEAFAEAVDTIARFLVPFDCWSLMDYGLYGTDGGAKKLTVINDHKKAAALLKLLDLTVGSSEGAVIPYDLTDALDQIATIDSSLSETAAFRRLSTSARR